MAINELKKRICRILCYFFYYIYKKKKHASMLLIWQSRYYLFKERNRSQLNHLAIEMELVVKIGIFDIRRSMRFRHFDVISTLPLFSQYSYHIAETIVGNWSINWITRKIMIFGKKILFESLAKISLYFIIMTTIIMIIFTYQLFTYFSILIV